VALTAQPEVPQAFLDKVTDPKVRKLAATDQNIRRLLETVREVEAEAGDGIARRGQAFRASPLGQELGARLAKERLKLATEAGLRARGKLEYERDQLRAMLAQALRIQIEVSRQEREALESSLAAGSQVEVVKNLRWTHAVSDEQLYWPYEGEFWRDELGTYSYTLTKGCKDRPPGSTGR
jgi:primosomal replication protein N